MCIYIYIYIYIWWLSIRSSDDVCVLQLIYEHVGGSAAPTQRHRDLNSGGTGSQFLWSLSRLHCSVSLWQQWVFGIEPLQSWLHLCKPSLAILVCPWHIPPGLLDWCGTTEDWLWPCIYTAALVYLDFFCQPEVPCISDISASDTPPFESHVQPIEVGPWWRWPLCLDLAWSRTSGLVMWSCHPIPRMELRACMWDVSMVQVGGAPLSFQDWLSGRRAWMPRRSGPASAVGLVLRGPLVRSHRQREPLGGEFTGSSSLLWVNADWRGSRPSGNECRPPFLQILDSI